MATDGVVGVGAGSSPPIRSKIGAGDGEALAAAVWRERRGCVPRAAGAGDGAEAVGVGLVGAGAGAYTSAPVLYEVQASSQVGTPDRLPAPEPMDRLAAVRPSPTACSRTWTV